MPNLLELKLFYILLLGPIFLFSTLNFILDLKIYFGVKPRLLSINGFFGLLLGWTVHASISHLINNLVGLIPASICLLFVTTHPLNVLIWLILGSSLAVWIFGEPNSFHIGCSGVIYSMIGFCGYTAYTWVIDKKPIGLPFMACLLFLFGHSIIMILAPKKDTSFSGHLMGFLSGIAVATLQV